MNRPAGAAQGWTLVALGSLPTLAIAALVPVLDSLFARFGKEPNAEWLVPMILTVPSLCVAASSGLIGMAADRFGRRPILLAALLVYGVFGLAPFLFEDLHAIIYSRVGVGLAEATILTVGNALMGDYFPGPERQKWLGMQVSVGPFIGTAYIMAGGFLGRASWHGPFLLYLLGIVMFVVAWRTLQEPEAGPLAQDATAPAVAPSAAAPTPVVSPGGFPWGTTAVVCGATLVVSVIYFLQAVQHGRIFAELGIKDTGRIGLVVSAASMGTVVGGIAFRRMGHWRIGTLMAVVLGCYGLSYIGVSRSPDWITGMAFDAIGQFAGGLGLGALLGWAIGSYDFAHRGRGMGLWAASFFLGQFLSPPFVTLLGKLTPGFLPSVGSLGVFALGCAAVAWLARGRAAAAA